MQKPEGPDRELHQLPIAKPIAPQDSSKDEPEIEFPYFAAAGGFAASPLVSASSGASLD